MAGLKDDNILRLLKKLNLASEAAINRMFQENDLTAAQCDLLNYLLTHEGPGLSATQAHLDLGLSRASISTLLKRLKGKGYVTFEACPHDDRQKGIRLTEKARQMEFEMDRRAERLEKRLFCGFSAGEQRQLEQMLLRMLMNIKPENEKYDKNGGSYVSDTI